MKQFPLLIVAALLGAAVSVPAQLQSNGLHGRLNRGVTTAQKSSPRAPIASRSARVSRSAQSQSVVRKVQTVRSTQRRGYAFHNGALGRYRASGQVVRSTKARSGSGRLYSTSHGHWVTRYERVFVPGYWDVERHPAQYGWVYGFCGIRQWGVTKPAHNHRIWVPGRYENQACRRWVCY